MRRIVLIVAAALLTQAGCVQSQYVPNIFPLPTATPTPASPPLIANPNALTLSASALGPPNSNFGSVTVTQQGAGQSPFLIQAQSTCLLNGNLALFSSSTSGSSSTFTFDGMHVGACVLVFGGIGGVVLTVPVQVNP